MSLDKISEEKRERLSQKLKENIKRRKTQKKRNVEEVKDSKG